MKLKTAILISTLAAVVFSLAGCVDRNNNPGTSTTTTSATVTSTTTSRTEPITSATMDGDYEADKDGKVNDDDDSIVTTEDEPDRMKDRETRPGDVTDDGIVSGTSNSVGTLDEAAFASSYMGSTALKNDKIGWGLGKERDDKNRPLDAVNAEKKYAALGAKFLAEDGKICLTFDEGYENGHTAEILDTLKEKNVKAVFFVTYDYCKSAPELVQRMIDEGHVVGNHTWSHPSLPDCTQKEVWSEVTKLHDYVKSEFGYEMTLFRFPKGEFSERTLDDVHNLGYTSLFWSFAYADWDTSVQTDPAEALAKIEDSTHSGIYLLHAVSDTNAKILGKLIEYWQSQGYTVGSEL